MVNAKTLKQLAAVVITASTLLFATVAFAANPPKASKQISEPQTTDLVDQLRFDNSVSGERCAVAAPSPMPQGTQQIQVCNNWTAPGGSNAELFNTTGQSCAITAGTTTWPFVQSAPLNIANGTGLWVTLITPTNGGGTYNYLVNCCPNTPSATHTVDVGG